MLCISKWLINGIEELFFFFFFKVKLRRFTELGLVKSQMQVLKSPYQAKFVHWRFLGVTESLPSVMVKLSLSTRLL